MAMEKAYKNDGDKGRLIPVPRSLSAGCGLAWCAETEEKEQIMQIMEEKRRLKKKPCTDARVGLLTTFCCIFHHISPKFSCRKKVIYDIIFIVFNNFFQKELTDITELFWSFYLSEKNCTIIEAYFVHL